MKINFSNTNFYKSFYSDIKTHNLVLPEIAFVGRSNVGKSSLINFLVGQKNLAKVSQTPGKTQSINYFNVDNKFFLVDLPGFGYSKLSKEIDLKLKNLIDEYFKDNKNLLSVCHLIDSRHPSINLDKQMNFLLENYNYSYFIVLTKSDKIKNSQRKAIINELKSWLPKDKEIFFIFSSVENGEGKREIQNHLTKIIDKN